MNIKEKSKGFTIIEVVLVLAIAGLIFLVVFLAVPALQKSQRDQARQSSMGTFTSQLITYQSNNAGILPISDATLGTCASKSISCFVNSYLSTNWTDPSTGTAYVQVAPASAPTATGSWRYVPSNICNGDTPTPTGANGRNFAVQMKLEASGLTCYDNK